MTRLAALVVAALATASCAKQDASAGSHSTDYFRQHPVERADVVRQCEHGVGGYQTAHQAECGTAEAAQAIEERAADAARRKH